MIKHKGWNLWINGSNVASDYTLPKYAGCTTVDEIAAKDSDYLTNDIVNGVWTEHLPDLTDGLEMFYWGEGLTTFNSDLSSLTNGECMFGYCYELTTFTSDLGSLTNGQQMFYECSNLTTFTSDLSSLTNGAGMFWYCYNLTNFSDNLSSLTDGSSMFYDCTNLTTFTSDLSSLTNGECMFTGCSELTTFNSDLSSLTVGYVMFESCKLNTASIQNIAETINTVRDEQLIHIGIGNSTPNEQEVEAFNTMVEKGWIVYVNCSSNAYVPSSTALIPIDGEETTTHIPFYAKPIPSDEEHAHYTDSEGNYYNILGAQFIYGDDLSTYGMFTCEGDAAANMRLTKIEK